MSIQLQDGETVASRFSIEIPEVSVAQEQGKGFGDQGGPLHIRGIASDEREDLDGEVVSQQTLADDLEYLKRYGVFNWNHGSSDIGKLHDANLMPSEEAKAIWKADFVGENVLAIHGQIDSLPQTPNLELDYDRDLMQVHRRFDAGRPMGLSIQGFAIKKAGEDGEIKIRRVLTEVAVTPKPKNAGTTSRMEVVKSMAHLSTERLLGNAEQGDDKEVVVILKSLVIEDTEPGFKALAMDSGTGSALRRGTFNILRDVELTEEELRRAVMAHGKASKAKATSQ